MERQVQEKQGEEEGRMKRREMVHIRRGATPAAILRCDAVTVPCPALDRCISTVTNKCDRSKRRQTALSLLHDREMKPVRTLDDNGMIKSEQDSGGMA